METIPTVDELAIDPKKGYPAAYTKLARLAARHTGVESVGAYQGPPQRWTPYEDADMAAAIHKIEARFPYVPKTERDRRCVTTLEAALWDKLAPCLGFDPDEIRVDKYGNVIHRRAQPNSTLAGCIDHIFPVSSECTQTAVSSASRRLIISASALSKCTSAELVLTTARKLAGGGLSTLDNLQIIQWQANSNKQDKLEFTVPWWDLQIGALVAYFIRLVSSTDIAHRGPILATMFAEGEEAPPIRSFQLHPGGRTRMIAQAVASCTDFYAPAARSKNESVVDASKSRLPSRVVSFPSVRPRWVTRI